MKEAERVVFLFFLFLQMLVSWSRATVRKYVIIRSKRSKNNDSNSNQLSARYKLQISLKAISFQRLTGSFGGGGVSYGHYPAPSPHSPPIVPDSTDSTGPIASCGGDVLHWAILGN